MHATLAPKTNIRLIAILLVAAVAIGVLFARPLLWMSFALGAVIGAIIGVLQLLAIRKSDKLLLDATSAIAIRRALTTSGWGKAYVVLFWIGSVANVAL